MQLVTGRGSALQSAASHSADFKGLILPCVGEHAVPAGKDSCLARPIRTSEGRREKSVPGLTLSACARQAWRQSGALPCYLWDAENWPKRRENTRY